MLSIIKKDWLILLIVLVPFTYLLIFWNSFPETIAIHFDATGKPNGFAEKGIGLLMIPAINIGVYLLMLALPFIDPLRSNYALFIDKFAIIRLVIHAFLTFMFFVIAFLGLGYQFNMMLIVLYGVLAMFMVLGNYMGTIRPNFFIGVRTPWTLSNTETWRKTHRLTARLWVFTSILMMIVLPMFNNPILPFIAFAVIIVVVPIMYSYLEFKKVENSHG